MKHRLTVVTQPQEMAYDSSRPAQVAIYARVAQCPRRVTLRQFAQSFVRLAARVA